MFERIKNNACLICIKRSVSEKMSTSSGFVFLFCLILSLIILFGSIIAKAEKHGPANGPGIPVNCFYNRIPFTVGGEQDLDPFSWMIKLYKRYLSSIKSSRCPMYPSCSNFAVEALKDHREKGLVMTFDRLLRCGWDLEDYTLVFKRQRVLRYDPVIQRFESNKDEPAK